jgi:hypothetical protein
MMSVATAMLTVIKATCGRARGTFGPSARSMTCQSQFDWRRMRGQSPLPLFVGFSDDRRLEVVI